MPEIKYEITEHLGVISETARGWTREVNMSKGLTFTKEEIVELKNLVEKL